jgi:hypothetical protein
MPKILPVLTLGLIATAAQSDSAAPKGQGTALHGAQTHGMVTAAPRPPSYDEIDPVLMGILAVAAIAFQFRRRYRVSQRAWQRIAATTDTVTLERAASTPRPPLARMRWLQIH